MDTDQNIDALENSFPQNRALYFLGSGASASSGAPTFRNFFDKSLDISKELKNDIDYQMVLEDWRSKFAGYTIEDYFSAIEMSEMIALNKEANLTTKQLTDFIAKTIEKSLTKASSEDYRIFIEKIIANHDAIVTTNWDILLETEIQSKLANGEFDYISVECHDQQERSSKKPIPLFKLHGSLNWAQCPSCYKVYYFYEKVYSRFYDETSNIPKCKSCNNPNNQLSPIIIPPTFSKLKNNIFTTTEKDWKQGKFLNKIWSEAYSRIALSNEIYFIGYSFPQTDAQMRIFVSMALNANKSYPLQKEWWDSN
jgi:NAD-dependent SIR2 family protein deacetylase